jgi:cyclin-dependent kinase 8/11
MQTFTNLPHSSRVTFNVVPPVDLSLFLPNCPSTAKIEVDSKTRHFPTAKMVPSPLDLVHRFLVFPECMRLTAPEALLHPWFTTDPAVLLPTGYHTLPNLSMALWEGKTLGEWLVIMLPPAGS